MRTYTRECACCGKEIRIMHGKEQWSWKLDGQYYCSSSCYSKVFDSKYKEFKLVKPINLGTKRDKTGR